MSIARSVCVFLRDFLVRQYPYDPCCASCGEVTTPLNGRLCTSLTISFPVDAVVLVDGNTREPAESIAAATGTLEMHCPWLRRVIVVADGPPAPAASTHAGYRILPSDAFMPPAPQFGAEAYLHTLPELGECYLITRPGHLPVQAMSALDFFTPNGIPLLRLRPDSRGDVTEGYAVAPGILPQTKKNAMDVLDPALNPRLHEQADDYATLLGRWAFAAGRAVPSSF